MTVYAGAEATTIQQRPPSSPTVLGGATGAIAPDGPPAYTIGSMAYSAATHRNAAGVPGSLVIIAVVAAAVSACSTPVTSGAELVPSGRPANAEQAAVGEQLPGAINDFGVDLLAATAAAADKNRNVIVSPISVHAALSMAGNGATGETSEQMRKVLRTDGMSTAQANEQWAALLGGLAARDPAQRLDIANALFARKGLPFKQPFLDADRDYFGAQVSTVDFERDDVPGIVNGWVSKNTRGMIPKILDEANAMAILYLANAVYFRGDWVSPFDHEATTKRKFGRPDGSRIDVDMMGALKDLPYAENEALLAAKLLYQGRDTSFYVLLPRSGVGMDVALASLKGRGFANMRAALAAAPSRQVILELPQLDTEFGADLNKPLSAMGMPRAFDQLTAEFSDMADLTVPIYIGRVLHKAKVTVDEKGTEAAAATVVEMRMGAVGPPRGMPEIICDRPYLFAIVDEPTGTMLFLGMVGDPTK